MIFTDRKEAGEKLAEKLSAYKNSRDTIIMALPRGGVVIGFEIAKDLHLPLDIVVPRKIGAPYNPELAIGAITEDGQGIFHQEIIEMYGISPTYIAQEIEKEKKEAQRRLKLYRNNLPPTNLQGKTVLLVDDGIATAATIRAAIISVRVKQPSKIIVVTPVISPDSLEKIRKEVDEVIVLDAPYDFRAVGQFYKYFPQTTDEEVINLMKKLNQSHYIK